MRKQLEISGGLVLAMLATGVMFIPTMGLWPLVGIAAVCGTTLYVAEQFNNRR